MSDGDFGGGDFGHGGEVGSGGDHGDNDHGVGVNSDKGTRTGILSNERKVEVHVQSHGALDVKRAFIAAATGMGLVSIEMYRPNLVAEDRLEKKHIDWDAWNPPDNEKRMPDGHYPGATGWTRLWKEFWQVGKRVNRWLFWTPLEPAFEKRTWITVSAVTWHFEQTGDFETRLEFEINSLHVWDPAQQAWIYDAYHFAEHKKVAEALAKRLLEEITRKSPPARAEILRGQMRNSAPAPAPAPAPAAGDGRCETGLSGANLSNVLGG